MQIVIDIPEEVYIEQRYVQHFGAWSDVLQKCFKDSTPLPKGHGRLIDVSDLMPDSDYEDGVLYAVSIGQINGAPTIIEAERSEANVSNELKE